MYRNKLFRRVPVNVLGRPRCDGRVVERDFAEATPLHVMIESMHNGSTPLHPVGEAAFDSDDVQLGEVDPANTYGVDRFEYQEALAGHQAAEYRKSKLAQTQAPTPPPNGD